ncbi:SRPBCC domain-containing protein [Ensifer sp. 4252]|uniref:SRPBCC domain-containing protein n=1 Tax=Ensifer sp. 4252 TaxID=3373915 RepID=UPI003D1DEE52
MNVPKVEHATVVVERTYAALPHQVFAAWSNREALAIWSAPGDGWELAWRAFDFTVGHADICTFGAIDAEPYVNTTRYEEIRASQRIVYASTISHLGTLIFAGVVTVEFSAVGDKTRLVMTESGAYLDGSHSPLGHGDGWAMMLDSLGDYLKRRQRHAA